MSNGGVRKVSLQDIQLVQNLIERCLQLYMNEKEVVSTLLHQAKIEPTFTELVWQKLEAENQEFFMAYHLRLIVKDQILQFNQSLKTQIDLMRLICQAVVASNPLSTGSQICPTRNSATYHTPEHNGPSLTTENIYQAIRTTPNAYTHGASSHQLCMSAAVNMASHVGRIGDVSADVPLAQSSNAGRMQGMNGEIIKSEAVYADESAFMLEPHTRMGDASGMPFSGMESNSQALNETILDPDVNSFGFLRQLPRNFSLSDLTADFSDCTGYFSLIRVPVS